MNDPTSENHPNKNSTSLELITSPKCVINYYVMNVYDYFLVIVEDYLHVSS